MERRARQAQLHSSKLVDANIMGLRFVAAAFPLTCLEVAVKTRQNVPRMYGESKHLACVSRAYPSVLYRFYGRTQ
jgi:hypothetical protein